MIHLQSLLDEDDRPSAQRSIDDQHLIDSLERQLFTKQGECSDLVKQAERYQTEAQHHTRNMRDRQSALSGLSKELRDREKALAESTAAIVEKDRLIAQLREHHRVEPCFLV